MIYIIKLQNQNTWGENLAVTYINIINDSIFTGDVNNAIAFDDSVDSFDDVVDRLTFNMDYKPEKIKLYDIDELVNL